MTARLPDDLAHSTASLTGTTRPLWLAAHRRRALDLVSAVLLGALVGTFVFVALALLLGI